MILIENPWIPGIAAGIIAVILGIALIRSRYALKHFGGEADIHSELLHRISRQLDSLDRIGERVEGLDNAFRIPRVRGGFGESLLEELLRAWLPEGSWTAQYPFPDGTRVDAVIRMGSRLVPVDSKFPLERLENWLKDEKQGMSGEVKRTIISHAEAISSKYIRPDDGTLSFALMYIPAENMHYRLLRDDDGTVMKECLNRHVLPVGPMSLFAYLQTVSYGLKGLALPAEGQELRRRVGRLRRDFSALVKPLATASTHLKNLNKSWEELERRTIRMEDSVNGMESRPEGD
ncbi:MAG: DNA recombination protein RmuC [Spirochaetaceae bacterium]|nr:DNA recombination protein RmuC [Spirochaetaceae bacterium]RKX74351.1 MAG: DNA recombination protein RmuC [Spirochaetota bacterium]RKX89346.1 MAG: DNA recombination protein RmuC [Spirochaetota bacterium]RKX98530.1 MAG: DNA recombination protein RmuC [Spirochaetota bacterium]